MDTDTITSLVGAAGSAGALVWYLYHTTASTIPGLVKQFTDSNEKIAERFATSLDDERSFRKAEMSQMRDWIRNTKCEYAKDEDSK